MVLRAALYLAAVMVACLGAANTACAVGNDNFADALELTGEFGQTNGVDITGFTAEAGEPSHAGVPARTTAWFKWTAPVSGLVQFNTFNSAVLQTVMAVYTGGPSFSDLNFVVANRYAQPAHTVISYWAGPSLVKFNAKAGQTYYIAVGRDPATGSDLGLVSLRWAYHSAGMFRFTTDNQRVSETDGSKWGSASVDWSALGARVTVTRVGGSCGRAMVDVTTTDDSAIGGTHYSASYSNATPLVFDDWEMSKSIIIPVYWRSREHTNTTFSVSLSNPRLDPLESPAIQPPVLDLFHRKQTVTILDYDYDSSNTNIDSIVNFERSTYRTREDTGGFGYAYIFVQRDGTNAARRIAWAIDRDTYTSPDLSDNKFKLQAGSDYATPDPVNSAPASDAPVDFSGTFNYGGAYGGIISWGQDDFDPKLIMIPINNDTVPEFNEDIHVKLFKVPGATDTAQVGQVGECTITILYDDYPAGALDAAHNPDYNLGTDPVQNATPGANGIVYASAIQADGKCLIGGDFTKYNAFDRNRIARMNVDGSHDDSFNPGSGANDFIASLVPTGDGKIVIGGGFTSFNGQPRYHVARLEADGALDPTFNPGLGADATVWSVAVQPDGKVLIGGEFTTVNSYPRPYIARLNVDGSVDETFTPTNALNGPVEAVAVATNGTVYVGGQFTLAGALSRNAIARLNTNGVLDTSFNPRTGVNGPVYALALQADGRLLIGGTFDTVDLRGRRNLARLNTDGTLDTSFDPGSGADGSVYALTLSPDGRIFIGGAFLQVNGTRRVGVARLFTDGKVDTGFMDTAYNQFAGIPTHYSTEIPDPVEPRNFLLTLALQTDGNLIIGGSFHRVGGGRLNRNIQTNDFDFTRERYDEEVEGNDGYSRQAYRNRYNVARLLGGDTDGPGNIGLLNSTYAIDETSSFMFVKTIREHGTLGVAETTFSIPPGTGGSGIAQVGTDYAYNNVNPRYKSTWPGNTRNLADGVFGTNNIGRDVLYGSGSTEFILVPDDDIYVTIPRNPGIQGDRTAQLQLDVPSQSDIFFLGGENVPLASALGRSTASLQINDADTAPGVIGLSSAAYTVNENGGSAVITLTRTNGSSGSVSALFSTLNGTAVAGVNYTGKTNVSVTFGDGITNKTVNVTILNNSTVQADDLTVLLALKSPTGGATLGQTNAVLSIIDDDFLAGRINFTTVASCANEYASPARVTVTRTGGNLGTLNVQCATLNGTATAGVHYVGQTNTLHWDSGDTSSRYVDVVLLPDGLVTTNLNFNVRLSNPTIAGALGARTNVQVTILNGDFYGSPQFSAANYYVSETGGYATVTVNRVGGSAETLGVNYATSDGTAVSTGPLPNFVATNGTLVFGPGEVSRSFTVPILNDGVVNTPITFGVTLSGLTPGGATLGSPVTASVSITDAQSFNQSAGSLDPVFNPGLGFDGDVSALALQPGGLIVAGGDFTTVNGLSQNHLTRLNPNATPDTSFMAGLSGANGAVRAVISQSNNRLLVGGQFTSFNSVNRNNLTRLNTDGTLDTTFDPGSGADAPVYALAESTVDGSRRLYVGGEFSTFNGVASSNLVRLLDNGTVDNTFTVVAGVNGPVYAVAVYATNTINAGKVVIGGAFSAVNGVPRANIARLNVDGSLDPTFNPGSGANSEVRSVVLQPDGKVLIGGAFTSVAGTPLNRVARLNLNGTVDNTFEIGAGCNGVVYALAVSADNRIVVGGDFTRASGVTRQRITRLLPDGKVDPTINFGSGANGFIDALLVQPDGNLVLGGGFTVIQGQTVNHIARIFGGAMTGPGQVEFDSPLYVVDEDGTSALITLRRIGGTSGTGVNGLGDLSVNLNTGDNTALAGINYTAVTPTVTFPVGEVTATVLVPVLQDHQVTADLLATLALAGAPELLGPQSTALLEIINVDSVVHFSAATYERNEDASDGLATIALVREGCTNATATVWFNTTASGTAVAGVNYQPVAGVAVTFLPGETVRSVTVPVLHNPAAQGNRTVGLALSSPVGTLLSNPAAATLTINDISTSFSFSSPAYAVLKTGGSATIEVIRTGYLNSIASVNYATQDGTGSSGVDYTGVSGTLVFATGQTQASFTVPVINSSVVKPDKTVLLELSNPVGSDLVLTSPSAAVLTIHDNSGSLVVPAGSALVSESGPVNGIIDPGETVSLLFALRNGGGTNTANLMATLLATNGITLPGAAQNYGALLMNGPSASRQFSFTASGTNGQAVAATFQLQDGAANVGTAAFVFVLGTSSASFTNGAAIVINDNTNASPYPSAINVSGVGGSLTKATVTLNHFKHTWPRDVDALLVSPSGQKVLLMAAAGGSFTVNDATLTFDDSAPSFLPSDSQITSGSYQSTIRFPGAVFQSPAPAGPYATNLAAFNGSNPNGYWSLFIHDHAALDSGIISNGWSLNLTTANPVGATADLVAGMTALPGSGVVGGSLTYTLTVTNFGPSLATGVILSDLLPGIVTLISSNATQGSVSAVANQIAWNAGTLALNTGATLTLTVRPTTVGTITNTCYVQANETDPFSDNNTASVKTTVELLKFGVGASGGNLVMTWQANAVGCVLECVTNLNPPLVWLPATGCTSVVSNGQNVITIPIGPGSKYFRLREP